MKVHEKLNYVEFPATDLVSTKRFFEDAFGWEFEDFGPDYCAFADQGLDGGFFSADLAIKDSNPKSPGPKDPTHGALLVFYSDDLGATQSKIETAGGTIVKQVFSFPGGRRFHFSEPSGNEFAVWSDL